MYEKISSYDWLFDVRYYKSLRVISFKTNVDDVSIINVGVYSSIISYDYGQAGSF